MSGTRWHGGRLELPGIIPNPGHGAVWDHLGMAPGSSSEHLPEDSWEPGLGSAWEVQELEPGMSRECQEIKLGMSLESPEIKLGISAVP